MTRWAMLTVAVAVAILAILSTSAPTPAYAGVGCADALERYRNVTPPFDVLVLTTATKVDFGGPNANDPRGGSVGDAIQGDAVCAGCNDPCPEPTWYLYTWNYATPGTHTVRAGACTGTAKRGKATVLDCSTAATTGPPPKRRQTFVIDLKAWIPAARVVDPLLPVAIPFVGAGVAVPGLGECQPAAPAPQPGMVVASHLLGDRHKGFAGSYRALGRLSFEWDGESISNSTVDVQGGASSRQLTFEDRTGPTANCVQTKSATPLPINFSGATGNQFQLSFKVATPLVEPSPAIDAAVNGTVRANGSLRLRYTVDRMPNIGMQVHRDGQLVADKLLNDVSCLRLTGIGGARRFLTRLNSSRTGRLVVPSPGSRVARCP